MSVGQAGKKNLGSKWNEKRKRLKLLQFSPTEKWDTNAYVKLIESFNLSVKLIVKLNQKCSILS